LKGVKAVWEVVKGLAAYDALKWLWRNIWALGCFGLGIAILLFPLVWVVGQTILAILGWEWVYKSMVKRPTWGNRLLFLTALVSLVTLVGGICVAAVIQSELLVTISIVVGMGYLYYGGAVLGLVVLLSKREGNSGDSTKEKHCRSCGSRWPSDARFCVRCGAMLEG
jgi:hypothetical protein